MWFKSLSSLCNELGLTRRPSASDLKFVLLLKGISPTACGKVNLDSLATTALCSSMQPHRSLVGGVSSALFSNTIKKHFLQVEHHYKLPVSAHLMWTCLYLVLVLCPKCQRNDHGNKAVNRNINVGPSAMFVPELEAAKQSRRLDHLVKGPHLPQATDGAHISSSFGSMFISDYLLEAMGIGGRLAAP